MGESIQTISEIWNFTDKLMRSACDAAETALPDFETARKHAVSLETDGNRLSDSEKFHIRVGMEYLVCASRFESAGEFLEAGKLFHFAGHQLRNADRINQAAVAYKRSGECLKKAGEKGMKLRIRSLARAKSCYLDAGDIENADITYSEQQDARLDMLVHHLTWKVAGRIVVMWTWKVICRYGTSLQNLSITFIGWLGLFTLLNHSASQLNEISHGLNWRESLMLTVQTGLSFSSGTMQPLSTAGEVLFTLNLVSGYILIAAGITILLRVLNTR